MAIQGLELLARIQSIVNLQTRAEGRQLSGAMSDAVRADLEAHGAARQADDIFDTMRRARRDFRNLRNQDRRTQSPELDHATYDDTFIEFLYTLLSTWGDFTEEQVREFYSKHQDLFEELLRRLNHSRSKAAHILAVLRPFKEKYISGWEKSLDLFPAEKIRKEAARLEQALISTDVELETWLESVYELFVSAAVFKGELTREFKQVDGVRRVKTASVPMGMISESSERIYRQRWNNWRVENELELQKLVNGDRRTDAFALSSDFGLSSSFMMTPRSNRNISFLGQADASESISPSRTNTSESAQVHLTVSSSTNSTLSAERTWLSEDSAALELVAWLGMLEMLWGEDAQEVAVVLEFVSNSGKSRLPLPPVDIEKAKSKLPEVIKDFR